MFSKVATVSLQSSFLEAESRTIFSPKQYLKSLNWVLYQWFRCSHMSRRFTCWWLIEDVKVGYSLGFSDMVEFRILHGKSKAAVRTRTLNFWRALLWPLQGPIWRDHISYRSRRGSKRTGQCSSITSSKLRANESPWGRNQAKEAGDLHGWAGSSQQISNGRKKCIGCGEKDRPCGRTRYIFRVHRDVTRKAKACLESGKGYQGKQEGFLQVNQLQKEE